MKSAALLLAACAAILAAGPASAATTGHWRIAFRVPSRAYEVEDVTTPARDDAWAFVDRFSGDRYRSSVYLHWAGHGWNPVAVPHSAGFVPDLIASAGPGAVWILGTDSMGNAEALAFNGEQWTLTAVPEGGDSLVVLGSDDVWIGGFPGCSTSAGGAITCTTTVEHWDGTSWHASTLPVGASSLAGAGGHVWLAGSRVDNDSGVYPKGKEAVFQWASGRWVRMTAPDGEILGYPSLGVSPRGEVWLVARTAGAANLHLDQRTGQRWSRFKVASDMGPEPNRFQLGASGRGFWLGSDHWTGSRWIRTQVPGATVYAVSGTAPVPGTSSVWGVAQTGGTPVSVLAIFGATP